MSDNSEIPITKSMEDTVHGSHAAPRTKKVGKTMIQHDFAQRGTGLHEAIHPSGNNGYENIFQWGVRTASPGYSSSTPWDVLLYMVSNMNGQILLSYIL